MAICALASARAKDKALYCEHWNSTDVHISLEEWWCSAAEGVIDRDISKMTAPNEVLDWMRACALLVLYGIQVDHINMIQYYLRIYHALVSTHKLHDEKNWPKDIGLVEKEVRRRLVSPSLIFWTNR